MKIYGGTTTSANTITYYSEHYIATAILNKDTEDINVIYANDETFHKHWYMNIPILRCIISNMYQSHVDADRYLKINILEIFFLIFYIIEKIFTNINLLEYMYGIYFLIYFAAMKRSDVTKLHGAEHAVYNYYDKFNKYDDVEAIRNENRTVDSCGTTSTLLNISLFYLIMIDDVLIRYFLSIGLAVEIVRLIDNYKFFKFIGKPVIQLSRLMQLTLTTRKPEVIHIKTAIAAIKKLEELEEEYIEV
jgi:uncharacterized protein YqhQ